MREQGLLGDLPRATQCPQCQASCPDTVCRRTSTRDYCAHINCARIVSSQQANINCGAVKGELKLEEGVSRDDISGVIKTAYLVNSSSKWKILETAVSEYYKLLGL